MNRPFCPNQHMPPERMRIHEATRSYSCGICSLELTDEELQRHYPSMWEAVHEPRPTINQIHQRIGSNQWLRENHPLPEHYAWVEDL